MKKHLNIMITLLVALALGSCSKEDPFGPTTGPTGTITKSALKVELQNEDGPEHVFGRPEFSTRAPQPDVNDFVVKFYEEGVENPVAAYTFGEMPEIITLPAGAITAVATYGENAAQGWETPYYKGETKFIVVADRVNDDIDPIVASLANVRVTIVFAPGLQEVMSDDSKVTVVVGDNGKLDFTLADANRSGYFAYVENSRTLTATFSGKVEGYETVETKGYDNVAPGNHYRVTFSFRDAEDDGAGDAVGSLVIDASVEVVDMNLYVDDEQEIIKDDMRPVEGGEENPEQPNEPEDPNTPAGAKPSAVALEPTGDFAGYDKLDLNAVNEATDHLYCAWQVSSEHEDGFKVFTVDIISNTLTPGELSGVGLTDHIDLINPGQYEEALDGLGFPVNVGGHTSAQFDITGFLSLLGALGEGNHEFRLTVTDANGTSIISVKLHTN